MIEDLDVEEWELYSALQEMSTADDEKEIRNEVTMPKVVERWTEVVGQFSLHNEYPAQMAFFTTLGQILKDKLRVPVGRLSLDPRIHFCWIQTARSGKTTMFDFLSPVWAKTFEMINEHPVKNNKGPLVDVAKFTLENPDAFTDQALLGTIKKDQPNPQYATTGTREERQAANVDTDGNPIPELIDQNINGALFGSGIIAFDEFEHSGIFKETQHKQDTVMMFQKFMNRLDSDTHLIKKRLTEWGKDLVVDCQRSLWATTLPPQGLEKVILTKGVFQRMWLYVREVPETLKMQMEGDYLDLVGKIVEDANGADAFTEEFSEMLYDIYSWVEMRHKKVGDKRLITTFTPEAQERLKTVWRGMRKYMDGFPPHIYAALNTFLMNTINNMCNAAALCACAERSTKITARHIDQAKYLTDQSFNSITTWFNDKLKKSPKRVTEQNRESGMIKVYQDAASKLNKDGWVSKTELVKKYMQQTNKSRPTFYREWSNLEHLFDKKKTDNRVYIKIKKRKKNTDKVE